jgi:hypothetical protein
MFGFPPRRAAGNRVPGAVWAQGEIAGPRRQPVPVGFSWSWWFPLPGLVLLRALSSAAASGDERCGYERESQLGKG